MLDNFVPQMEEEAMRRQPEPIYATLLETFQQAMEHTC